jgi:hypothetical protein
MLYFWRTKLFNFIEATTSQETHQIKPKPHATSKKGKKKLDHTKYYERTSFVFSFHSYRLPHFSLLETAIWSTYYGLEKIILKSASKHFRDCSKLEDVLLGTSAKQHAHKPCLPHQQDIIPYFVKISVLRSWRWAKVCPKHVGLILKINKTVIVASSWCSIFYFTYIDDARSNINQV